MTTDLAKELTPVEVAAILRATGHTLVEDLLALPDAVLSYHPAPGEWCAKEALGHLIEAEQRGFAGRIRVFLAEDEPQLVSWDPPAVARERQDCARDLTKLLDEFVVLREESVVLVAGLQVADLRRGGLHPTVGYQRTGDVLHEWVHHDRNHIRQIYAAVQAYVWPFMGAAQRFSSG